MQFGKCVDAVQYGSRHHWIMLAEESTVSRYSDGTCPGSSAGIPIQCRYSTKFQQATLNIDRIKHGRSSLSDLVRVQLGSAVRPVYALCTSKCARKRFVLPVLNVLSCFSPIIYLLLPRYTGLCPVESWIPNRTLGYVHRLRPRGSPSRRRIRQIRKTTDHSTRSRAVIHTLIVMHYSLLADH